MVLNWLEFGGICPGSFLGCLGSCLGSILASPGSFLVYLGFVIRYNVAVEFEHGFYVLVVAAGGECQDGAVYAAGIGKTRSKSPRKIPGNHPWPSWPQVDYVLYIR